MDIQSYGMQFRIRGIILRMEKPFCISDLIARMEQKGINDRKLILQVLDEMYEEGVIEYRKNEGIVDSPDSSASWCFCIA